MNKGKTESHAELSIESVEEASSLSNDIIMTLLYFDIFKYPLTSYEILNHSSIHRLSAETLNEKLSELLQKKLVQTEGGFFFLPTQNGLAEKRNSGNQKAAEYIQKAKEKSNLIVRFPFVRGIFLSGSVSKGYADINSDIDYFIVTTPGRLWLSRTLLILYKKIFLLNSRKFFCLNYFVDTNHLEIKDKNVFTAIELSHLLPLYNKEIYDILLQQNSWTKKYFPNFTLDKKDFIPEKNLPLKNIFEKILSGFFGEQLDNFCLFITEKFWKYKFRKSTKYNTADIRCYKHVSKFHPQNFQNKVLIEFEKKISAYASEHNIDLRP